MRPVFADPKADFIFKRIFGSEPRKHLLIELLNTLLELEGDRRIRDLSYLAPEQMVPVAEMKLSIVDVKCVDQRDTELGVASRLRLAAEGEIRGRQLVRRRRESFAHSPWGLYTQSMDTSAPKMEARASTADASRAGQVRQRREDLEQIPLTPEDLVYPQEGDQVSQGLPHFSFLHPQADTMRRHLGKRPGILVTSDVLLVLGHDGIWPSLLRTNSDKIHRPSSGLGSHATGNTIAVVMPISWSQGRAIGRQQADVRPPEFSGPTVASRRGGKRWKQAQAG